MRPFIDILRDAREIIEIGTEVSLDVELGSVLVTAERLEKKAVLFKRVKGHTIPVVGGVLGSQARVALALECSREEVVDRIGHAMDNPIKPAVVGDAPFYRNIIKEGPDLGVLPIPRHAPKDAAPFITGGVTVGRNPATGVQNLSFQRQHVKGPDTTGMMINEWRHLRVAHDRAEEAGDPLPVAVAIGVDPVVYIAAGIRYEGDEIEIAGSLLGRPYPVARCVTNDLLVPADSEIVIEGELLPGVREMEGPLAEFSGHYGAPWDSPVFRVTAICHRDSPIYQTIAGAGFEHVNLGNVWPREPLLKRFVTHVSGGVRAVHIAPYGAGFLAIISLKKSNPGEPKNVALAAMTAHVNIKNVIVVDDDVDVFDPQDVMWSLSTRVRPDKDIFFIPNAQGHELDPTSDHRGVQIKMGIDATLDEEKRGKISKVVYPLVDMSKYLTGG
ncbi:MAG: UbiD family decarboxylase [Firmicutes bacterium]|nr:UbiD family decarboxylase [Bacillota bacterium]